MNAKTRTFLSLVPVCLGLLPATAAAQGSVGPLELHSYGSPVTDLARAGSLAFFTTVSPPDPYSQQFLDFLRSDGTPEGTFSIDPRGPAPSRGGAHIWFANSLGDLLFFITAKHSTPGDHGLWRTDGTVAGTFLLTQGLNVATTLALPERNLEFFAASPRTGGPDFELWVTDGTAEGTRLVKDVNPEGSSNPSGMIAFDGRLFFLADTPHGRELWRSDGTPEGTERVRAIPKHDFYDDLRLVQAGGALFILESTEPGMEAWRSDGTEAGTEQVLNLPQRYQKDQGVAGGHLFFTVEDAARKHELWAIDGGTGEAVLVRQSEAEMDIQFAFGNQVGFSLEDDHGREPWLSDGTPEGTHRMADICPGSCSSSPSFSGTYGGRVVLRADDGVSGTEPWLTDGTATGTWRLGDLCPGECSTVYIFGEQVNGWLVLESIDGLWVTDGTRNGAWSVGSFDSLTGWVALPNNRLFIAHYEAPLGFLSSLPLTAPAPRPGAWMESASAPGFRFKVEMGQTVGRREPACMARTLCVSGAVPGRSEVFLRMSEPGPDGRQWPSLIKLTPSPADVWVLQTATGYLRHYRLQGSGPAGSTLSGILDREGFLIDPDELQSAVEGARRGRDPQPPGRWIEYKTAPGFRVQARLTSDGKSRILRKEPCIAETFCLSGATPGVTDLLVRVSGPKPNKYFWPMLARFAPATLEVWVQQRKTGKIRYYRLNAPPAGSSQLDGYFDRQGFKR